jgi:hypothetical protein
MEWSGVSESVVGEGGMEWGEVESGGVVEGETWDSVLM